MVIIVQQTTIENTRSTRDLIRAAMSGWLGTTLEFMDFQLYALGAALVFHHIFFPEQSAAMSLILAMGTYGAGYVARIAGAFFFGRMGDSIGRKQVLFITITMMGLCTTLIGVLPTYAQVGILAPILLVFLRVVQGFGAGAEISGARTMLAEYAPKGKKGAIASLVALGTNCGTLSATAIWAIIFIIFDHETLLDWAWRIPFLASAVVMVFAIWLRLNLKESPVFESQSEVEKVQEKNATFFEIVKGKSFWLAMGLRFGQAGNSGIIQTFLAGYMVQALLFSKDIPTDAILFSSIVGFFSIPFVGWLSDKLGRRSVYLVLNTLSIILAYPMISIIVDKSYEPSTIILCIILIHNISVLGLAAIEAITMAEMFGARNRFTQMALANEFGGLMAVGFGPLIAGILTNIYDSWWPIAIMVIFYSVIGLISALIMPEIKDRDLNDPRNATDS